MDQGQHKHLEPQFKAALESPHPFEALWKLAQNWRDQGMTQETMYSAFMEQYKAQLDAQDERLYDALADTVDLIVGWCAPGVALYPGSSLPEGNAS